MAEIESRKDGDKTEKSDTQESQTEAPEPGEDLSEDQEAALNNIMAEIDARKDNNKDDGQEDDVAKAEQNLSLDEFSEELTQLLSTNNASQAPQGDSPANPETTDEAPVQDDAVINEALKEIIGNKNFVDIENEDGEKLTDPDSLNEYPILKEIDTSEPQPVKERTKPEKSDNKPKKRPITLRKSMVAAMVLLSIAGVSFSGYWAYHKYFNKTHIQLVFNDAAEKPEDHIADIPPVNASPSVPQTQKSEAHDSAAVPAQAKQTRPLESEDLTTLMIALAEARQQLLSKKTEIENLKAYYQKGIEEEEAKVEAQLKGSKPPSFSVALQNPKIELALKAIQRRLAYIEKVESPIESLFTASEELLFLQRRTKIYNVLMAYISGFPVLDYKGEVQQIMADHLDMSRKLNASEIIVNAPELEIVWKKAAASLKAKTARENAYTLNSPKDRTISAEICNGNFDQKYLLTVLNPDTARCIIKWTGKDLFLNELKDLPMEVAEILVQWPGDWLSLNGLKELSSGTAGLLSKWPGKRLSLNGLTSLSAKATEHLSKWQGEQLELIGLQDMGRWENYATRLYLSEKMQRKIEGR
jgi:hypothetical protein